jgi:2'-5' RNA ligase
MAPFTPGRRPRQKICDRLFFALLPEFDDAHRLAQFAVELCTAAKLGAKLQGPRRLHVSLQMVAEFRDGIPAPLVTAVSNRAARVNHPAFDVAFDRALTFERKHGPSPGVLLGGSNIDPLLSLHEVLWKSLDGWVPRGATPPPYLPHMTLFYGDTMTPCPVPPVAWRAREIVLMHSVVGLTEHRRLASWPLS